MSQASGFSKLLQVARPADAPAASSADAAAAAAALEAVVEPASFTPEERRRQRSFCSRTLNRGSWLPVVADLAWGRTYSQTGVALVLTQVFLKLLLQTYLPRFGLPSIRLCGDAVLALYVEDYDFNDFTEEDFYALKDYADINLDLYFSYMFFALVALSPWNAPMFVFVGTALSIASFGLQTFVDARFCFRLASYKNSVVYFSEDEFGNFTHGIAFYNLARWAASLVVSIILLRLSIKMAWALCNGKAAFLSPTLGPNSPQQDKSSHESSPLRRCATETASFWREKFASVPTRHVFASLISSIGLVFVSIYFTGFITMFGDLFSEIRTCLNDETCRPSSGEDLSIFDYIIYGLLNIPEFTREQILGTLQDICTYGPYGVWAVMAAMLCAILYSFIPISAQHGVLVKRYAAIKLMQHIARVERPPRTVLDGESFQAGYECPPQVDVARNVERSRSSPDREPVHNVPAGYGVLPKWQVPTENASPGPVSASPSKSIEGDAREPLLTQPEAAIPIQHLLYPLKSESAPDLRLFSYFSATQYVLSHLLTHLVVFLFATFLVTLIAAALVIYFGGFAALGIILVTTVRAQLYTFCVNTLPSIFVAYVITPVLGLVGVKISTLLWPFRRLYMALFFWLRFDDGPFVLAPRVLLAIDLLLSATVGAALGVVDAFTRIILGLLWGVLRTVVMHEPVVPMALAALDRPYMAYGGMMKMAHVELFDSEATGEDIPPKRDW